MFVLIFPLYGNTSIPQAPRFSSASPIHRKAKTSGRCKHTVALYRRAAGNTQRQRITLAVRIQESPAFWSVGCLKHKSKPFRLRFALFTTIRSADFPLFPSSPARFFSDSGSNVGQTRCTRTHSNSVSPSIAPEATARPTSTTSSFVQSSRIPLTSRAELIYDRARKSGQKTVRTFLI